MKNLLIVLGIIILLIGYCAYKALNVVGSVVETVVGASFNADVNTYLTKYDFAGAREYLGEHKYSLSKEERVIWESKIDSVEQQYIVFREENLEQAKKSLKSLHVDHDEFEGVFWYRDKSSPKYTNQNGLYLYFGLDGDHKIIQPLRIAIQYQANDWIFFEKVAFNIDGEKVEYDPARVRTETDDSGIFEWVDQAMHEEEFSIISRIIDSKESTIRLYGRTGNVDRKVTETQKKAMSNVLKAYELLGGSVI